MNDASTIDRNAKYDKVIDFFEEHELVACSTGAVIFTSLAYSMYRLGRGVHKIISRFRK